MGNFLQQHLDYVYFVYGLAFVLIAAVCAVIPKESARGVPWIWLGLFGLTHGVSEWLEIFPINLQDTPTLGTVRTAAATLSYVFLCEFGRKSLHKLQRKVPGRWIYLPLLALAASGASGGPASLHATTRYALALIGGLCAAWALYLMDKQDERSRGRLAVVAIGMAGYAVAAGVIISGSGAPFFPASVLNADWFVSAFDLPIQIVRGAFGVLIATALWAYSGHLRRIDLSAAENKGVAPLGYGLAIVLAVTLVAGWRFAEFASDWADDEVRDILRIQAGTAAVGFTPEELAPLRGTTVDWSQANYRHLKQQMQAVSRANPELRSLHLLILRDGNIHEAVAVDAKYPGRAETGVAYERPPRELLQAFSPGIVTTLGPYRGGSGDLVSAFAPIRDPRTDAVVGVLGIDISADDWKRSVAEYRLTAMFVTLLVVLLVIYFFIVRERMWRSAQLTARSEQALHESEARFRSVTEMSSDFYWESDAEHRLTQRASADRTLSTVSVFQQGAQIGQRRWEIPYLSPDEAGWQAHRAVLDAHQPFRNFELSRLGADGTERHISISGDPMFDESGAFKGYRGVGTDITARKRSEQALRDTAAQLRLFADNIPAMTVSLDANLRYVFVNKRFADFFGFDPAEIVGKHLREVIGEESFREIEGYFAQALQGYPVTYQRKRKLANGEYRHLEAKLLPHVGDQGKVVGCFALTTDITEHKLTEERIQRVAHHDSLTGLPNRLLFNDRLEHAISLAKRDSRQFALLYLDLDKFKPVNDALGHAAGDELLQAVAARIRHQVRESDTVARVGGDEFTVILSDIARREDAQTVATKIIAALTTPFQLGSQKQRVDIGTSIGIALYPADGRDADALVEAADAAMYGAKQIGSSFRFFEV